MKSTQFGANLHETWRRAATETVHIQCGKGEQGRKTAVALRHRLYQLRRCLEKENSPLAGPAARVSLHLRDIGDSTWVVIASVADTKFDTILDSAGIKVPEAPDISDLLVPPEPKSS